MYAIVGIAVVKKKAKNREETRCKRQIQHKATDARGEILYHPAVMAELFCRVETVKKYLVSKLKNTLCTSDSRNSLRKLLNILLFLTVYAFKSCRRPTSEYYTYT